jgi:hypothetical protein
VGKKVNVVLWDGRTVTVDETDAARLVGDRARRESDQEATGRSVAAANEERASGVQQGAAAILEGIVEGGTGGIFGKVAGAINPDYGESLANRGQHRPGMRAIGEIGSFALPGGLPNQAAKAGAKVAAKTGSRALGRVAEGSLLGVGAHVAGTNVTGDPLSIEGALEDAGLASVLNLGFGLLGDKLTGAGKRAQAAVDQAESAKANLAIVAEGQSKFAASEGAYSAFREVNESAAKSAKSTNTAAAKETLAREKAANAGSIRTAINKAKDARAQIQSELADTPAGRHAKSVARKNRAAETKYTEEAEAYEALAGDDMAVREAFNKMDASIKKIAPEDAVGNSTADRAKVFRERRSIASQKMGGWDGKAGRWTKADGNAGDIHAALDDLRALRDDIAREFPTRKMPLPDVPARPVKSAPLPEDGIPDSALDDELRAVAQDLSAGIGRATGLSKAGSHADAMAELEALHGRVGSVRGDLVFHKFPPAPRAAVPEGVGGLPKSIDDFAKMTPEKVGRLGDSVNANPAVRESFDRLAADLGLPPGAAVADIHADLRKYTRAMDELEASRATRAAKEGRDDGFFDKLGNWGKRGLQSAAGRGVDIGGPKGAFLRALAGGAVGYGVNGVEGGLIGASLAGGKAGVRNKLNTLTAKFGGRAGSAMKKLGPVTGYLAASWPFGEPDNDSNFRNQAHNRIGDVIRAAQSAPDAGYMAVEGILGHPGDIGFKVHQMLVGATAHLADMAPRDPGIDVTLRGSNWRPSAEQSLAFAHRLEAVTDPLVAIARTISGDGHPAAAESLWAVYPAIMSEFAQEFMLADHTDLTYEAEARMAQLLRLDIGLRRPEVLATVQGMYLPQPEPAQAPSRGTGGPPGRPAAVQSPVAGSSVSALTA